MLQTSVGYTRYSDSPYLIPRSPAAFPGEQARAPEEEDRYAEVPRGTAQRVERALASLSLSGDQVSVPLCGMKTNSQVNVFLRLAGLFR